MHVVTMDALAPCEQPDAEGCSDLVAQGLCLEPEFANWMTKACRGGCKLCDNGESSVRTNHPNSVRTNPPSSALHQEVYDASNGKTKRPTPSPTPIPTTASPTTASPTMLTCGSCMSGNGPCISASTGFCTAFADSESRTCASGFKRCAEPSHSLDCERCDAETSGPCKQRTGGRRCMPFVSFGVCIDGYRQCASELFVDVLDESEARESEVDTKFEDEPTFEEGMSYENAGCTIMLEKVMQCDVGDLVAIVSGIPNNIIHFWSTSNKIQAVRRSDLDGMELLQHLYLSENLISHVSAGAFDTLISLQVLLLDNNLIRKIPNNLFVRCTSLRILDLRSNSLFQLTPTSFLGLNKLKNVNLYDNELKEIQCGSFSHFQDSLEYFNTQGNPSSCVTDSMGVVQCTCANGYTSTGFRAVNRGYCLKEDVECAWAHPVFPKIIVTTTTTTTTTTTLAKTQKQFKFITLEPGWRVPIITSNTTRNESAANNQGGEKENGKQGDESTTVMMGSILAGVVAVALVGLAAKRHISNSKKVNLGGLNKNSKLVMMGSNESWQSTGSVGEYDESTWSMHRKWTRNFSALSRSATAESDIWQDKTPSPPPSPDQ